MTMNSLGLQIAQPIFVKPRSRPARPAGRLLPMRFSLMTGLFVTALGWGLLLCHPIMLIEPSLAIDVALYAARIGQNLILTGLAMILLVGLEHVAATVRRLEKPKRTSTPVPPVQMRAIGPGDAREPLPLPRDSNRVASEGQIAGRRYQVMGDGTVSMETLLGHRRFETLDDACAFIGG